VGAAHRQRRGRPVHPSSDAVHHPDGRAADLEVVVVVGLQFGQRRGVPVQLQVLDRPAGRVTCVVPAFEGDDHQRSGGFGAVAGRPRGLVDGLTHRTSLRPPALPCSACPTACRRPSWPPCDPAFWWPTAPWAPPCRPTTSASTTSTVSRAATRYSTSPGRTWSARCTAGTWKRGRTRSRPTLSGP